MSIKTDAVVIRDEITTGANTAVRVGTNLVAIADDLVAKQAAISANTSKISYTDAAAVALNTAKVSNIAHPLVEKAVPINAVFTDTVYDDTAIQAEVDLNTAKNSYPSVDSIKLAGIEAGATADQDLSGKQDVLVSGTNIKTVNSISILGAGDIPITAGSIEGTGVLSTGEGVGRVLQADGDNTCSWVTLAGGGDALTVNPLSQFAPTTKAQLDGVISDGDVLYVGDVDTAAIALNTAKETNIAHPLVETAVPVGAVFTDNDTVYDDTAIQAEVDLNTAKVGITTQQAADIVTNNAKETNIAHPLVETAVPIGALFTDTVYNDTTIQAEVTANTAKISFDSTSSTRLADTSGTNTGDQFDRLIEATGVSGNYTLDYSVGETWFLTLTGLTSFLESNLPTSGTNTKIITIHATGGSVALLPAWNRISGAYDGLKDNTIVVEYIKTGEYRVLISQAD